MIIYYFHVLRSVVNPLEANPPLIINANRILSLAVTLQRLQPVTGRNAKIVQSPCRHQVLQLPISHTLKRPKPADTLPAGELFRVGISKASNQRLPLISFVDMITFSDTTCQEGDFRNSDDVPPITNNNRTSPLRQDEQRRSRRESAKQPSTLRGVMYNADIIGDLYR